jgi:hypothetical protein
LILNRRALAVRQSNDQSAIADEGDELVTGAFGMSVLVRWADVGAPRQGVPGGASPLDGVMSSHCEAPSCLVWEISGEGESSWTGLTSFGGQARAKVRAKHVLLALIRPSADLRLIFISLYLTTVNRFATRTYENPRSD